tara:strand:+ start:332 stop:601 length:270 start_codon:yes stop_codon:yes gene_type:complete
MILDHKENMNALNKMSDVKDALFYRELNAKIIRENRELKEEIKLLRGEIGLDDCKEGIKLKQEINFLNKIIKQLQEEIMELNNNNKKKG